MVIVHKPIVKSHSSSMKGDKLQTFNRYTNPVSARNL